MTNISIRFNNTANLWEYDTSVAHDGSSWATLPIGAFAVDSIVSLTGTVSVPNAAATTLFSVATTGMYEVFAYYPGASAIYLSSARVLSDGSYYRATFDNGAGLTLSLSGSNIQAFQSSGGALSIHFRVLKIA